MEHSKELFSRENIALMVDCAKEFIFSGNTEEKLQ